MGEGPTWSKRRINLQDALDASRSLSADLLASLVLFSSPPARSRFIASNIGNMSDYGGDDAGDE